ncbi:GTPase Era [Buchnera aphidicola]|uniref:GTPase Era n=1 Tax=Buchnera aphidicola TaxID=9 RepID=UPI0031B88257
MKNNTQYSGTIAIIGKSNAGKSSILNKLIGEKISIISPKLHTTQENMIGIKTDNNYQAIYIDTPGLYQIKKDTKSIIEKKIDRTIYSSNIIIFVTENIKWNNNDELIAKKIKKNNIPTIIVINKIDLIKNKNQLLPHINFLKSKILSNEIIFVSAKTGENIEILSNIVKNHLPISVHQFPKKQITNCSKYFIISEIIREKIIYCFNQELPYSIKVKIESYYYTKKNIKIHAIILVKNVNHKKIIIGNKGKKIKLFNILARKEISNKLQKKICLFLWVKIDLHD